MDAMHPQDAQSGFPPNWHGVIFVRKSAEQRVGRECENAIFGAMRRQGELPNHRRGHVQFRILLSQLRHIRMARARSSEPRISGI